MLRKMGMKLVVRNYRSRRGEIDLILWDEDCLVFAEVKTRASERRVRPAAAVNRRKRLRLTSAAQAYLRAMGCPPIVVRFDVVEVILTDDGLQTVRHLPNAFEMEPPYRYG